MATTTAQNENYSSENYNSFLCRLTKSNLIGLLKNPIHKFLNNTVTLLNGNCSVINSFEITNKNQ